MKRYQRVTFYIAISVWALLPQVKGESAILGATYSNGGTHLANGDTTVPLSFTSITTSEGTYTNFSYGTDTTIANYTNITIVFPTSTTPAGSLADQKAALGGSIVNDGLLNTRTGTKITFSEELTADKVLFIAELQTSGASGGEDLGLYLLDNGGGRIAGTGKAFDIGAGGTNLLTYDVDRKQNGSSGLTIINAQLFGSTLKLSDFTSVTESVWGIEFGTTGNNSFDPMVIGIASIPEPSTLLLLGACLMGLFVFRQRRKF